MKVRYIGKTAKTFRIRKYRIVLKPNDVIDVPVEVAMRLPPHLFKAEPTDTDFDMLRTLLKKLLDGTLTDDEKMKLRRILKRLLH